LLDTALNQSVGKKNAVAAMNPSRGNGLKTVLTTRGISEDARGGDIPNFCPVRRIPAAPAGKRPGSNLGALQIGEDGDGLVLRGRPPHGDASA